MRFGWFSIVLVLIIAIPACHRAKSHKPVYPVKGRVVDSHDKPAVGAMLVFHPVSPSDNDVAKPVAQVDESGSFSLTTYVAGDGAPEGEYAVTIIWPEPKKTPFSPPGPDQLKGEYGNAASPRIRFTVEKKALNEVPPIKLVAS